MSQAAVQRVLKEIGEMSATELAILDQAMREKLDPKSQRQRTETLLTRLRANGLLAERKTPAGAEPSEPPLVEWPGKPLSETIIEERR